MDRCLIFTCAGLRGAAISLSSIVLTLHLSLQGFSSTTVACVIALGLAGCAVGILFASLYADKIGRRKTVALNGFLMAAGGVVFACTANHAVILSAAFIGMVNGMGRDRGMGLTVEQAMVPHIAGDHDRTKTFAWYNLTVDASSAVGALLAFLPSILRQSGHWSPLDSYRWTWVLYSVLCLGAALLALRLSTVVEIGDRALFSKENRALSPISKAKVYRFAALSGIDSLGGGFLTNALISFWFFKRFGVDEVFLAPLFFAARIANGLSHLGAAWLAKRIGLINTMVFTHLPSSLLLMTVPFMPSLAIAAALFIVRELLVEMDVPTRQSYIMAIVKPEERTAAAGITNLTRSTAWAVSPMLAAPLMGALTLSAPLIIGPGLKVIYDVMLYRLFRHIKPPEEK